MEWPADSEAKQLEWPSSQGHEKDIQAYSLVTKHSEGQRSLQFSPIHKTQFFFFRKYNPDGSDENALVPWP